MHKLVCLLVHAEHWERSERRLTQTGQYCQLIMHVQATRAFLDIAKCFKDADVVLADTMMAEVKAQVLKLQQKLPEFEKRYYLTT